MRPIFRLINRRPMILLSQPGTLLWLSSFTDVVTGKSVDYWDDEGQLVMCTNKWGFGKVTSAQEYSSKYRNSLGVTLGI